MSLPESSYRSFLSVRRQMLLERIADAAARSGRQPSEITLLAVSKTVGPEELVCAYDVGYRCFGENRPQELVLKSRVAEDGHTFPDMRFDLIGNLQKNKINQVLAVAPTLIHSVSSTHLAEAISLRAQAHGMTSGVLLEVNVSGEASKSGFSVPGLMNACETLVGLPALDIAGVMAMAPAHDPDAARRTFAAARDVLGELRERTGLPLPVLSCGMSDDFELAIEEGSTLVRLGRVVFDPNYRTS